MGALADRAPLGVRRAAVGDQSVPVGAGGSRIPSRSPRSLSFSQTSLSVVSPKLRTSRSWSSVHATRSRTVLMFSDSRQLVARTERFNSARFILNFDSVDGSIPAGLAARTERYWPCPEHAGGRVWANGPAIGKSARASGHDRGLTRRELDVSDLTIEPANYGGDQMPWAEYVIAGNIVFLSGAEGRDMSRKQEYPDGEPRFKPLVKASTRAQSAQTLLGIGGLVAVKRTEYIDRTPESLDEAAALLRTMSPRQVTKLGEILDGD